jgi:2-oxo-4-hydroxy-4-carboxy--5-ureidoimidazoline (OHCU) decarboxylase
VERLESEEPYPSVDALLTRAREVLYAMPEAEQLEVIAAHPRIGERAEIVQAQSSISFREQGYGRDPTPPAVLDTLQRLNAAYERRFGFRFVVFVNQRLKGEIVPVLEARLRRPRDEELATALAEILAIARDRARAES